MDRLLSTTRTAVLRALVSIAAVVFSGSLLAGDVEADARNIEGKLMAPCCMANTLAEHHSGPALQMRQEIREMLRAGSTEGQIIDHYVEIHGDQIRAIPPARGFNLVAWFTPPALLLLGSGILWILIRRWRSAVPDDPRPVAKLPTDPEYEERLRRCLAEMD